MLLFFISLVKARKNDTNGSVVQPPNILPKSSENELNSPRARHRPRALASLFSGVLHSLSAPPSRTPPLSLAHLTPPLARFGPAARRRSGLGDLLPPRPPGTPLPLSLFYCQRREA